MYCDLLNILTNNYYTITTTIFTAKQIELINLFLEEGCSVSKTNVCTHTSALHIAIKKKNKEIIVLLLQYGADPLLKDKVRQ